jgi:hypothetical protein
MPEDELSDYFQIQKVGFMSIKIFNEYSRRNTVAFWVAICIGIALLICLVWLFINFTILRFIAK